MTATTMRAGCTYKISLRWSAYRTKANGPVVDKGGYVCGARKACLWPQPRYSCVVNTVLRARIPKPLLKEASRICREMGCDVQTAVRLMLTQLVKQRRLPFSVSAEDSEDELLQAPQRRQAVLDSFYDSKAR